MDLLRKFKGNHEGFLQTVLFHLESPWPTQKHLSEEVLATGFCCAGTCLSSCRLIDGDLHVGCRWSLHPHRWACGYMSVGEHTSYSPTCSEHTPGSCTQRQQHVHVRETTTHPHLGQQRSSCSCKRGTTLDTEQRSKTQEELSQPLLISFQQSLGKNKQYSDVPHHWGIKYWMFAIWGMSVFLDWN